MRPAWFPIGAIVLAAHLLQTEPRTLSRASIGVDNQAVILGCRRYHYARGQWAVDIFREKIDELRQSADTALTIRWTPGHIGIQGNEVADELAKNAANGPTHSSSPNDLPHELHRPVPRSAAAIVQTFATRTKARAVKRWRQSKQHTRLQRIDKSLLSKSYLKLVKHMTRRQSSLLIRLRTGHSPLNRHLWNIKVTNNPGCRSCGRDEDEDVRHFLLSCPAHERTRVALRNKIGARNAGNISLLLAHRKCLKPLFEFVDSTGCFRDLLGTISGGPYNRTILD
jgi:hypothetical protein